MAELPPDPDAIALPRDEEGSPAFREPWEAQAFAMTLKLHQAGLFTWSEWAARLAEEIQRAQAAGDPDLGDTYYHHWLHALEDVLATKGVGSPAETARWHSAWQHAASRTPHGKPIEPRPDDFDR